MSQDDIPSVDIHVRELLDQGMGEAGEVGKEDLRADIHRAELSQNPVSLFLAGLEHDLVQIGPDRGVIPVIAAPQVLHEGPADVPGNDEQGLLDDQPPVQTEGIYDVNQRRRVVRQKEVRNDCQVAQLVPLPLMSSPFQFVVTP